MEYYFSGTVTEKRKRCQRFLTEHGDLLRSDPILQQKLELLQQHIKSLDSYMKDLKMGALCSSCAATAKGGCCSAFMAGNTDVMQLVINTLLGVLVVKQHNREEECCYLGDSGCIFPAKPIFCLNYNCTAILNRIDQNILDRLNRLSGLVLQCQLDLENYLLQLAAGTGIYYEV